jgi:molybdate transport system substrate-binding protein
LSLATPAVAVDIKKRIAGGEAFDVAILNPELASELVKAGKVAAGTNTDFVRFGIGVAVRSGTPKPDIATSEALKQAVVNAKSITYTRGGSGVHFESLLSRWGIADQVKAKAKQVGGGEAIPAVAKGDIELGIDVLPQILSVPGAELVGPLPADLQNYVTLTVVISPVAKDPAAAKALVDFLKGPAAASLMSAKGMEPVR